MKALAEFVMGGRYRALLVALASSGSVLFCWIGAAVTALVTLRQGPAAGASLALWASLPALVLTQITGDTTPLALLLSTFVLALVLRLSVSLALAMLASALVGVLTGLATYLFAGAMLEQLASVFAQMLEQLRQSAGEGATLPLRMPTQLQLAGMMGAANAILAVLCLALGRYWQAALYNPGGFGAEFRALRLPVGATALLVVAAAGFVSLGVEYRSWAACLLVPVTVVGFALVHARAHLRGTGRVWLTTFYALWLLFDAAKLVLIGFAVLDAWVDFRRRWQGGAGSGDKNE
jgi:hypothetical protein